MRDHGLTPPQIDEMTLAQIALYGDDDDSGGHVVSLEAAEANAKATRLIGLTRRLENAGRVPPPNMDRLSDDEIAALWFSVGD